VNANHELYEELAVGHALNALEPEEEVTFLAHLPGCAACERAIAVHQETMGHLAYAAATEEPPASLLEGIRAGVSASGRSGAFPAPASLAAARQRRTVRMTTALIGVAASFVLLAALVITSVNLNSRNNDLQQTTASFRASVSELLKPGAKDVPLAGSNGQAAAVITGSDVKLVLSGVKANDAKKEIYVLWEQNGNSIPRAAGTFDVLPGEITVVSTGLKLSDPASVSRLMVTREPGRTAPANASEILYTGQA
jgi:hypothetical protein